MEIRPLEQTALYGQQKQWFTIHSRSYPSENLTCILVSRIDGTWFEGVAFLGWYDWSHFSAEERKWFMSDLLKSLRDKAKQSKGSQQLDQDAWLLSLAPRVHDLTTTLLIDGKKVIGPAFVSLWADKGGGWRVKLSLKDLELKWFGDGASIEEAFRSLERALGREVRPEPNGMASEAPEGPPEAKKTKGKGASPLSGGGNNP